MLLLLLVIHPLMLLLLLIKNAVGAAIDSELCHKSIDQLINRRRCR